MSPVFIAPVDRVSYMHMVQYGLLRATVFAPADARVGIVQVWNVLPSERSGLRRIVPPHGMPD